MTAILSGRAVRPGDRIFSGLSLAAGVLVLVVMAAIAVFLIWKAIPSLSADSANFLTEQQWLPDRDPPVFGIAVLGEIADNLPWGLLRWHRRSRLRYLFNHYLLLSSLSWSRRSVT